MPPNSDPPAPSCRQALTTCQELDSPVFSAGSESLGNALQHPLGVLPERPSAFRLQNLLQATPREPFPSTNRHSSTLIPTPLSKFFSGPNTDIWAQSATTLMIWGSYLDKPTI